MRWGHVSLASSVFLLASIGVPQGIALGAEDQNRKQVASTQDWAKHGLWDTALAWAEDRLAACDEVRDWDAAAPCRRFVAEALDQVFGHRDFMRDDIYLSMSAVAREIAKPNSGWLEIGRADDQSALDQAQAIANDGRAVLAVYRSDGFGHVALILPGRSKVSRSWKKRMPNAASIIGTGAERSFLGAPLSYAFSSGKAEQVMLYRRNPAEPAPSNLPGPTDLPGPIEASLGDAAITASAIEDDLSAPLPDDATPQNAIAPQDAIATSPEVAAPEVAARTALERDPLVAAVADSTAGAPDPRTAGQVAALGPAVPVPTEVQHDLGYPISRRNTLSGTWCGPEDVLTAGLVRAVLIDEVRKRLSWGTLQRDEPASFKEKHAHEILGVDRDGEVLGVTVADTSAANADATVFFIFSTADTLLETHRYDHVSHDIDVKGDAWTRCS